MTVFQQHVLTVILIVMVVRIRSRYPGLSYTTTMMTVMTVFYGYFLNMGVCYPPRLAGVRRRTGTRPPL